MSGPVFPVGKQAIEDHVAAHVERLSTDGAFYTIPIPPGDELVQVQVYAHPAGHWHYVTYGFTALYGGDRPPDPSGLDGFGYELTYRVPKESAKPSTAPVDLLRALARALVKGRHRLAANHTLPLGGPIAPGSKLGAFAVANDPELGSLVTPLGRVEMLLLVGITPEEERRCAEGATAVLLERLRKDDPLLVTRPDRAELPPSTPELTSQLDGQQVVGLSWRWDDRSGRYVVDVEPRRAGETFTAVLHQRLRSAGRYWIAGPGAALHIDVGPVTTVEEDPRATPPSLRLTLSPTDVAALRLDASTSIVVGPCELRFEDEAATAPPRPWDGLVDVVRAAFVDVVPALADGLVTIDRVVGASGEVLMVLVGSRSIDVHASGEMIGLGGVAIMTALRRLGGEIILVDAHPDPVFVAARALGPASAKQYQVDDGAILLTGPTIAVPPDDIRTDEDVVAYAERRRALASALIGVEILVDGPWAVQRRAR